MDAVPVPAFDHARALGRKRAFDLDEAREEIAMDFDVLRALDPKEIGRRLQEARKARGRTQQEAAEHLSVARTTITAIEKGERRIQASELVQLAALYGRSIGEFLRRGMHAEPFT